MHTVNACGDSMLKQPRDWRNWGMMSLWRTQNSPTSSNTMAKMRRTCNLQTSLGFTKPLSHHTRCVLTSLPQLSRNLTISIQPQRCQNDNREIDKEKEAQIRREQATKEFQAARAEAAAARAAEGEGDASLDALLENLKNGPIVRRSKKRTPGITPETSPQPVDNPDAPAAKAMDMLAALKTGGLGAFVPSSPRSERPGSGRRRIRPSGLSISSSAADLEDSESVSSAGHSRHGTRSTIFEEELPTPNGEASET